MPDLDRSDHPSWKMIESAALEIGGKSSIRPRELEIELSKAISLKRIADVLEGATGNDGAFCAYTKSE